MSENKSLVLAIDDEDFYLDEVYYELKDKGEDVTIAHLLEVNLIPAGQPP